MSFSLDFSSPISTGDFQCLDDYMLSHSVNEYKTYSDLCSLSLSSITSLQTALNLIKTAVTDLQCHKASPTLKTSPLSFHLKLFLIS